MTDARLAEVTKYAASAMLATRISFMIDLAVLTGKLGADIERVRKAVGTDPRIGPKFLFPGMSFGGSCFPKDIAALLDIARGVGQTTRRSSRGGKEVDRRQERLLGQKI